MKKEEFMKIDDVDTNLPEQIIEAKKYQNI